MSPCQHQFEEHFHWPIGFCSVLFVSISLYLSLSVLNSSQHPTVHLFVYKMHCLLASIMKSEVKKRLHSIQQYLSKSSSFIYLDGWLNRVLVFVYRTTIQVLKPFWINMYSSAVSFLSWTSIIHLHCPPVAISSLISSNQPDSTSYL